MKNLLTLSCCLMCAAGLIGLVDMLHDMRSGKMIVYQRNEQLPVKIERGNVLEAALQQPKFYYYPAFSRGMPRPQPKLVYTDPDQSVFSYSYAVPALLVLPQHPVSSVNLLEKTASADLLAPGTLYFSKIANPESKKEPKPEVEIVVSRFGLRSKTITIS